VDVNIANVVLGLLVVGLILRRQLRVRPVREDARIGILVLLAFLGVTSMSRTLHGHHVSHSVIAVLVASLLVAGVLGGIRGLTVQVWREPGGQALRKGTAVTAGLWIASIAVHIGADIWLDGLSDIAGLGTSSIMVYLAITWAVQGFVVRERASSLSIST
jgi:hypothetical protein